MSRIFAVADAGSAAAGGGQQQQLERVVVAVRIRPLSQSEENAGARACVDTLGPKNIVIRKAGKPGAALKSQQEQRNEYAFDEAFGASATQDEVYRGTAAKHVLSVMDGINVTVIAYGATGAGKTHTMMGTTRKEHTAAQQGSAGAEGIIPQSLVDIFAAVRAKEAEAKDATAAAATTDKWSVGIQYCEVYNENVYDLLQPKGSSLKVLEDATKGIVEVHGLSNMPATSPEAVLELLRMGNQNRTTESTAANQASSRSHAILSVVVRHEWTDAATGNGKQRDAKLSLIDLAGSERASATHNSGARLNEGAKINRSLLALANCINKLTQQESGAGSRQTTRTHLRRASTGSGSGSVVNYRDSKLTHLLKCSLEGNCKMIIIANINPNSDFYEDSHNTLKYANRAKSIQVKPEAACEATASSSSSTSSHKSLLSSSSSSSSSSSGARVADSSSQGSSSSGNTRTRLQSEVIELRRQLQQSRRTTAQHQQAHQAASSSSLSSSSSSSSSSSVSAPRSTRRRATMRPKMSSSLRNQSPAHFLHSISSSSSSSSSATIHALRSNSESKAASVAHAAVPGMKRLADDDNEGPPMPASPLISPAAKRAKTAAASAASAAVAAVAPGDSAAATRAMSASAAVALSSDAAERENENAALRARISELERKIAEAEVAKLALAERAERSEARSRELEAQLKAATGGANEEAMSISGLEARLRAVTDSNETTAAVAPAVAPAVAAAPAPTPAPTPVPAPALADDSHRWSDPMSEDVHVESAGKGSPAAMAEAEAEVAASVVSSAVRGVDEQEEGGSDATAADAVAKKEAEDAASGIDAEPDAHSVVAEATNEESAAAIEVDDQTTAAKQEVSQEEQQQQQQEPPQSEGPAANTRRRRSMIPRHRLSLGGGLGQESVEAIIAAPTTEAALPIKASPPPRGLSDVTNSTEPRPSSGKRRKTTSRASAILAQCKVKISRERRSSSRRSSTTTRRLRSSTSSIAPLGHFDGMNAADMLASVMKEN